MNGYSLDMNCHQPYKGWEVEHLLPAGGLIWGARKEVGPGWRKQVTGSTFPGLCISSLQIVFVFKIVCVRHFVRVTKHEQDGGDGPLLVHRRKRKMVAMVHS